LPVNFWRRSKELYSINVKIENDYIAKM
jgi:hypothetical protein